MKRIEALALPGIVVLLAAVLLAAVLLAGCGAGQESEEVEFRVPVSATAVVAGTVEDTVVATGTLRASLGAVLTVETAGFLRLGRTPAGRRLAEGDRVARGQVLAEIFGEDARLAAGLAAAEQRYRSAEAELRSQRRLHEEKVISEERLRAAEDAFEEAKLAFDRSQRMTEQNRITSPIEGVLLTLARDGDGLPMADGQRVERGTVVARVAPLSPLIADVDLLGADLGRVAPGLPARLRHHAWPEERFTGEVIRLAPAIDPQTRTARLEVEVANEDGRLRPGMFVEVTVITERREEVPVVPRTALTERGGTPVVFVLDGQRVSRREVTLGLGDDEVVEVRQGVTTDERVVVRGLETLTDGTRVRVTGGE